MLTLTNVTAVLAGVQVLRGVSASIEAGTMVAVVGRNGAGKTTLLRVIMGLLPLRAGDVRLDGDSLTSAPPYLRSRAGVGYAPEDRILFPTFSVEENLRFPCEVIGLARARIKERLDETIDIVPELKELLPRSAAGLSGGQGKMAALGRALMVATKVVLLDEPFQGLAPVLAQHYGQALQRLQARRPTLAVVVTESNAALLKNLSIIPFTLERGALVTSQSNRPEPI